MSMPGTSFSSTTPGTAFGMALYYLGYDVNTTDEAQIREAYQLVADAKSRGVYAGQGHG